MATNHDNTDLLGAVPVSQVLADVVADLRSRAARWRDRTAKFVPGVRDWKNKANACEFIARELEAVAETIEGSNAR